jgi:hypothetical protein
MKKPTKEQIAAEIVALKQLKPVGPFAAKTRATVQIAIDELQFGLDRTCEEWSELPEHHRDMAEQAYAWKEGMNKDKPSAGWGSLCA